TKISSRVAAAHRANALGINGPLILSVTRVLDEHAAFAGVEAGVARGASGEDAIHHVNAQRDVVGDLFRAADAHEIAWSILREKCCYFCRSNRDRKSTRLNSSHGSISYAVFCL